MNRVWAACAVLVVVAESAADQVVAGGANWPGVSIVGLQGGRLRFHSADGSLHEPWLDEVDVVTVDRGGAFLDLNEAERYFAQGDGANAVTRYRRATRGSDEFWPEFIEARLVQALTRTEQWDQAALGLVRLIRGRWTGPALAARLIPIVPPRASGGDVKKAIETVEAALKKETKDEPRLVLEFFRYELLRGSDPSGAAAAAVGVARSAIPLTLQCDRLYAVQEPALQGWLAEKPDAEKLRALNVFARDCPMPLLPQVLVLKGRSMSAAAQTSEEFIRAAWAFLRVVIHMPDDPAAVDALIGAAEALDRAGRRTKSVELLLECLAREDVAPAARQRAETLRSQWVRNEP
jgi:hypothetical protein